MWYPKRFSFFKKYLSDLRVFSQLIKYAALKESINGYFHFITNDASLSKAISSDPRTTSDEYFWIIDRSVSIDTGIDNIDILILKLYLEILFIIIILKFIFPSMLTFSPYFMTYRLNVRNRKLSVALGWIELSVRVIITLTVLYCNKSYASRSVQYSRYVLFIYLWTVYKIWIF